MKGSQREHELHDAMQAQDVQRVVALLDGMKPSDRDGALEKLAIDLIWMTEDADFRNALSLVIADLRSKHGADVIRALLRRPTTRGARGTLLYALAEMDEVINLEIFMDTVINDSFEAAEECLRALDEHRVSQMSSRFLKERYYYFRTRNSRYQKQRTERVA